MLLPSPKIQKNLAKRFAQYETNNEYEAKAIKNERRRMGIIKGLSISAILASFFGAHAAAYGADVRGNQELQANSVITVTKYANAHDKANNDNAMLFIDGVGTNNASYMAEFAGPAIQQVDDGQLWVVGQNNAHLSAEAIAGKTLKLAEKEGIASFTLVGQSGGGSETMKVQQILREESSIPIRSIFFMSAPNGMDGLQPQQKQYIDIVKFIDQFPGAAYSSPLRFIGQMMLESNNIHDIGSFFETAGRINDSLHNQKIPGSWLMIDQLVAIQDADFKTLTANIAKAPDSEVRSPEIYLNIASDPVVNDKKSSHEIGQYAKKAHIPYFNFEVPGAIHGQPQFSVESYMKVLKDSKSEIQASIRAQLSLAALHEVSPMLRILPRD